MYLSLYRKYRPSRFSEISGQRGVVEALVGSLRSGRIPHAFLFSGPRGCGKTSAARLLAKRLNCASPAEDGESCGTCVNCEAIQRGDHLDVVEIDGASNRGIEEIRSLKDQVALAPFQAPNKVYIIDEVHMLTEAAFNALLKTLEEPPSRVYFVLATTEPQKVPVTIRSRCVHFPFQRISTEDIKDRISHVVQMEGIEAEDQALWELARSADGALRDALSLLEQAISVGGGMVTTAAMEGILGGFSRESLQRWVRQLREDPPGAFQGLAQIVRGGSNLERISEGLFLLFRDLLFVGRWGEGVLSALGISSSEGAFLLSEAPNWDLGVLEVLCATLSELMPRTRQGMRSDVFVGLLQCGIDGALGRAGSSPPASRAPKAGHEAHRSAMTAPQTVVVAQTEGKPGQIDPSIAVEDKPDTPSEPSLAGSETPKGRPLDGGERFSVFQHLADVNAAVACVAAHCRILVGEEGVHVSVPEDPLISSILSQWRSMDMILDAVRSTLGLPPGELPPGVCEEDPPKEDKDLPSGRWRRMAEPDREGGGDSPGYNDGIREALSWLDGEVLYVRSQGDVGEEEDQQEDYEE
ncbi:DNA polymerase III subunit gamma/tau [Thermanaerovibrio acidaminovorans]|uniref:DNA polymerase III subunit gamma/tau n=1 Tax=Thermanaerovibrio acidaminovorans TaxID=81462 RepID=UPI0024900500|nr:DNA polymerase III subunit gamma/tau [Thermanaerovibrio acidaminovorans]